MMSIKALQLTRQPNGRFGVSPLRCDILRSIRSPEGGQLSLFGIVLTTPACCMPRITRRYLMLLITAAAAASVLVCATVFRHPLAVAYHQWRMNAEYNTIFGNPEPAGDGLASHDVRGVDVDAVIDRYAHHRQALVDLGVLSHMSASFPPFVSDGTEQQSKARSAFVDRMWSRFPGHKHYHLAGDGTFETWAPIADTSEWKSFIDDEKKKTEPSMHDNQSGNPSGGSGV